MDLPAILTLVTALTGAIVTVIGAIKGHCRGTSAHEQIACLDGKMNGRLELLLETTRDAAYRTGYADGQRTPQRPAHLPKRPRRFKAPDALRMETDDE